MNRQNRYANAGPKPQPTPAAIADELRLPESHWLVTTISDALITDDAIYLLRMCRKHLETLQ